MDHTKLPKDYYGIPIPQELTDDELGGMRSGVEKFMSSAFSVSQLIMANKQCLLLALERTSPVGKKQNDNVGGPPTRRRLHLGGTMRDHFSGFTCVDKISD